MCSVKKGENRNGNDNHARPLYDIPVHKLKELIRNRKPRKVCKKEMQQEEQHRNEKD